VTYLPRANEPVEPHTHDERVLQGWGCPTCIAEEAAAGGGGGGGTGPAGPAGPAGAAATVAVGTTTTGAAGTNAAVTNSGTSAAAVFNFTVPRGATGAAGPAGAAGAVGPAGPVGPASTVPGPAGAVGPAGAPGADGVDGVSISIQGTVPTYADLDPAAVAGDCYVVEADGLLYDFDGTGYPPEGSGVPWRGPAGIQGQPGIQGPAGLGITYKMTVQTQADLPATATNGDLYVVSEPAPAHGFVWDGPTSAWVDAGPVQGPQGVPGPQGESITGPQGPKGDPGDPAALPISTATVLGGVKVGTGLAVTADGTLSTAAVTGFLPLSGGTMTGTITVPSGSVGMAVNGTNYNMLGGSGGVAFRSGTTNIINHTASEVVAYVPVTTSGSGVGVRFGSGGPSLSKSGTMIAASAPITVAAAPTGATELANKAYVDSVAGGGGGTAYTLPVATATVLGGVKQGTGVTIAADGTLSAAGGGVANPVNGSVAGMTLWMGTQAAYDAIATKDAKTLYSITG
jgi:hypothetical protein